MCIILIIPVAVKRLPLANTNQLAVEEWNTLVNTHE